ncbi:PTS sugar transporter subunit IIA [Clostridium sp.]|uniref:PTS sugar transporter subunit IIA n=1 Tax=Clostridium sp. TaxID=1506 RepID=UPI0025BFD5F0|nr:PTS sugar transporter subunit IIA [Clostridium sp.]
MKEIGIILISHGHFAKYSMESAEMIVGKQENYEIISVTDDKDLENVLEDLRGAYEKLSNEREVIILADIFGGTPCNASSRMILDGCNVVVYTGFNLQVLLELLLSRELPIEEIKSKLEKVYKESFIDVNNKLLNKKVEEGFAL